MVHISIIFKKVIENIDKKNKKLKINLMDVIKSILKRYKKNLKKMLTNKKYVFIIDLESCFNIVNLISIWNM